MNATKRVFGGSIERVSSLIGKQPTLMAVKINIDCLSAQLGKGYTYCFADSHNGSPAKWHMGSLTLLRSFFGQGALV
jgi:hypothetical protein